MIQIDNKTYHYHAIVDKNNNIISKYPSKRYAIIYANKNPNAVAIKKVDHTIKEEIVWRKEVV